MLTDRDRITAAIWAKNDEMAAAIRDVIEAARECRATWAGGTHASEVSASLSLGKALDHLDAMTGDKPC